MKSLEERQSQGAGDHGEMPEGRTAIQVNQSKDRSRTQSTPRLFQVIPNLMLKTALINELLSFGRQFMLFTAMDQRTSSFFAAFHMRERTFFISQDIEDSSARRLKLWSKTNTEICVEP